MAPPRCPGCGECTDLLRRFLLHAARASDSFALGLLFALRNAIDNDARGAPHDTWLRRRAAAARPPPTQVRARARSPSHSRSQ